MNNALTDAGGLLVGHWSDLARGTGCTVVLTPQGSCCGLDVRGSAPGTRESALLDPVNRVDRVHGILLSGGSAFGLGAAHGVVRWLAEGGYGWPTAAVPVPIVPAAIVYDLEFAGSAVYPGEEDAYRACVAASSADAGRGSVGAGTGCTVGKLMGKEYATRGGLGQASRSLAGGVVVAALVAVNAVGDVVDPARAELVAGACDPATGELVDGLAAAASRFDTFLFRRRAGREGDGRARDLANTTIGVVATNLALSKTEATKLAQMAQSGVTRTTRPAHTVYDGDCLFALGTGSLDLEIELSLLGALAAEVVAEAVLDGVRNAVPLHGVPASSQLTPLPLTG